MVRSTLAMLLTPCYAQWRDPHRPNGSAQAR